MSPKSQSLRFETADGNTLHCLHWAHLRSNSGSNPPLILLHGGGANAHWWDHLAPRLSAARPVYALDFRGHGDSDYPADREVGAFNLDVEALLRLIGRSDVHLVGHSMGAAVALDHASRFGDTRSLTLLDLARGTARGSGRRARLALSIRRTYRTRAAAIDRFQFLPESIHAAESLRLHIASHSIREELDGRFGFKFDPGWFALPSKPRPDLQTVRCRTMLLRGEHSQMLSSDAACRFVADLPDGRLVEIEASGHHILLDQPERTLELLTDFLDSYSAFESA